MQLIKCNKNRTEMKHELLTIIKIWEYVHTRELARLDGVNKKLQC